MVEEECRTLEPNKLGFQSGSVNWMSHASCSFLPVRGDGNPSFAGLLQE